MIGLPYGEKLWRYVKPFSYNTSVLRTDRLTDGRTELLYQYRASAAVCWRAIKRVQFFWLTVYIDLQQYCILSLHSTIVFPVLYYSNIIVICSFHCKSIELTETMYLGKYRYHRIAGCSCTIGLRNYTVNHKKVAEHFCDHNSGKPLWNFIVFALPGRMS